jgi:serine/threonine protein phosphatase PrpC
MRETLSFSAATHTGLVRANNEDNYAIMDHDGGFPYALILADGMGGHRRGELSSQIAVDYTRSRLAVDFFSSKTADELTKTLVDILEKANVKVYLGSLETPENRGMGTTLTLMILLADQFILAHVGDCRAYLLRAGELIQLTVDHTLVQEMVAAGTISPDESQRHPRRNVLTRALGIPEYIQPDVLAMTAQRGDRLILCSDGLHGYVDDDQIKTQMRKEKTPASLAEHLVRLALEAGGEDNVTVLAAYL